MHSRCLVIFKTHFWDGVVQRQLERLQKVVQGRNEKIEISVILFVDETNGHIEIPEELNCIIFRCKSDDVKDYGIVTDPNHNIFWYSNDIPAIILAINNPEYNYYVMLEYDVVINKNIEEIIYLAKKNHIDFLAHPISCSNQSWAWKGTCVDYYEESDFVKYLNCFALFSREALLWVMKRRLYFSNLIREGKLNIFPNAEAFVATELLKKGFTLANLSDFGPVPHYDWSPSWLEDDLALFSEDAFIHPVSGKEKYISTTDFSHPFDYFNHNSFLYKRIMRLPDEMLPALYEKLRSVASVDQLQKLRSDMIIHMSNEGRARYGLDVVSIGRNCAAWQSSTGQDSHSENEACDVLNHIPNGHYSFHTVAEEHPWWMVDLGEIKFVNVMKVYNRNFIPDRAFGIQLFSSKDKKDWILCDYHRLDSPFEGLNGTPLFLEVYNEVRYLKLILPYYGCLNLDHIDIIGKIFS
ncbi:hypothetical protein NBRC103581_01087 [Gluconobacter wancherniae NBRC 103581]|nr:hypothetical protein NBRC103581_01087 [Gluconobacter wancherniae NBRC 103581]